MRVGSGQVGSGLFFSLCFLALRPVRRPRAAPTHSHGGWRPHMTSLPSLPGAGAATPSTNGGSTTNQPPRGALPPGVLVIENFVSEGEEEVSEVDGQLTENREREEKPVSHPFFHPPPPSASSPRSTPPPGTPCPTAASLIIVPALTTCPVEQRGPLHPRRRRPQTSQRCFPALSPLPPPTACPPPTRSPSTTTHRAPPSPAM